MAQQLINVGSAANDNTGDTLRSAFIKTNSNFSEIYGGLSFNSSNVTLNGELRGPASLVIDPAAVGDNTGTVVIKGNLQVDGTTTTINSTVTTIDDPIFTLGGDDTPTLDDNKDRGIEFKWHNGTAAKLGFFGYDDSAAEFTFIPDATNTSEVFSGNPGNVRFGGATFEGNVVLGDAAGDTLTIAGAATLSAGTANGVAYLNASKVLTTGSALTFDGTILGLGISNTGEGKFQINKALGATNDSAIRITDNVTTSMFFNNTSSGVSSIWSSGSLAFGVASGNPFTEQMRLTSTGLGIGTSSPSAVSGGTVLEVSNATGSEVIVTRADTALTSGDFIGGFAFKNTDADGTPPHYAGFKAFASPLENGSMDLHFYASRAGYEANSANMVLDASGRLLLGTTAQGTYGGNTAEFRGANIATLGSNITGNLSIFTTDSQAANVGAVLALGGVYAGTTPYAFGAIAARKSNSTSGNAEGYLQFYTTNSSNAIVERARITSGGNFIVGTTNDTSARLGVYGTGTENNPTFAIDVTSSAAFIHTQEAFAANITNGQTVINVIGREGSSKNSGYIGYLYDSAGSNNNKLTFGHWGADHLMNLTAGGNLGVGNTTPQFKVDVNTGATGSSVVAASFGATMSAGYWSGIHFGYLENANTSYRKSALVFERQDGSARGKIHILNNGSGDSTSATLTDSRITILYNGNTGVGTTDPGARLETVAATPSTDLALSIRSNTRLVSPDGTKTMSMRMLDSDVLTFSGGVGQLFSISDSMTGTIFAVNDVSGMPSIEVFDSGKVQIAELTGNVLIGTSIDTGYKLRVNGTAHITQFPSVVADRPLFPGGILGLESGDGNFDIWGISKQFYPSNATAADAWGILWNGDSNQVRFIGGGSTRLAIDLDGGSTGLTWEGNTIWNAGNDGAASGLDADLLDGQHASAFAAASHTHSIDDITDEHRIFNNMGDNHGTRSSFDASTPSYNFGWRYVQGNGNGPGVNSASQYYSLYVGLGNEYPATGSGSYGMQLAIPRNVSTPYIAIRYNESNSFAGWQKIAAGYADSAGRVTGGNLNPFSTSFNNALISASGSNRVVTFDGNGSNPSVWWSNGATAIGAIDAQSSGGGLTFWSNNGSAWQQQVSMTYGVFGINRVLEWGADLSPLAGWGRGRLSMDSGWGSGSYPTIGSVGGTTGSLIMIQNPHVPFRTDNARSGATGRSGLRCAIDTSATNWWDIGLIGDEFEIYRGSSTTQLLRLTNTGNLTITGSLFATTKSFLIDHPTKPGRKLRYGSLEGPENGVYVRGKLKGGNVIELPEYWTKLVDPDSITVQLTPIGKHQKLYVEDVRDNKVYVVNDSMFGGEINCFYYVQGERVDVDKLEVECD